MDTFIKNYWSLYNDFLLKFEKLTYKGFSLAYLCHLPSFVSTNRELWNKLYDPKFIKYIEHEVQHQKEIQAKFNQFVLHHTKKRSNEHNPKGKVVVHIDKLLRFPQSTFINYFDAKHTIILVSSEKKAKLMKNKMSILQTPSIDGSTARKKYHVPAKGINQITTIPLNRYYSNIDGEIAKIKQQAIVILDSYKNHYVFGMSSFREWLLLKLHAVMNRIIMSKSFFEDNAVSCIIVSTTHSYINRILAVVAAEKGIPTICMQHGIMSSELGYIPKIATIDAVYGQFEKDWYEKLGVSGSSIKIIGHPRFDQAYQKPKLTRDQFYRKLTLDRNKKTILFVVRGDKHVDRWSLLIKELSKHHHVNILIKNYPSNKDHPLVREFPFVFSTKGLDLYNIFPHVDVVVAYSSTVALEAMLAEKHVFILKDDFEGYTNYFANLGNIVQSDPNQLAPYIAKYLSRPHFREEVENRRKNFLQYAYPQTKKSNDRLKELIEKLTI